VLQGVAVNCIMLQLAAVSCSMLQWLFRGCLSDISVCCRELQCVERDFMLLKGFHGCLQGVAASCSMIQHVAARCRELQCVGRDSTFGVCFLGCCRVLQLAAAGCSELHRVWVCGERLHLSERFQILCLEFRV